MIFDGHLCKKNRPSSHWRVIHRSCLLAIYQAEITPLDNDRNPGTPIGQSVLRGGRYVWMLLSWWFSFSYFHVFSYHLSMASLPSFAFLDLVKGKIMQKPWSFVAKKNWFPVNMSLISTFLWILPLPGLLILWANGALVPLARLIKCLDQRDVP